MSDSVNKRFELIVGGLEDDEWPYPWKRDGVCYRYCVRCAIRMELPESQLWAESPREYCVDCDSPQFRLRPYGWNRSVEGRVAA